MGANFVVSWELLRLRRGEKRSMTDETTGDVLDHALPFRLLRGDSVLIVGKWKDREVEEKVLEVAKFVPSSFFPSHLPFVPSFCCLSHCTDQITIKSPSSSPSSPSSHCGSWLWQTMDIKVIRVGENIALSSDRYPGLSISLWSSLSGSSSPRCPSPFPFPFPSVFLLPVAK